jgi:hypothetical protein
MLYVEAIGGLYSRRVAHPFFLQQSATQNYKMLGEISFVCKRGGISPILYESGKEPILILGRDP